MMISRFARGIGCAIAATLLTTAASATTLPERAPAIFDFTAGWNTSGINSVSNGNARFFNVTHAQLGVFSIRATAWTLRASDSKVYASKLTVYDKGLGVISSLSNDDDNGNNGKHQIDNNVNKDFIVLQFNRQAKLTGAQFNVFDLSGTRDSDATIAYGTTPAFDWAGDIGIAGKTLTQLNAMFAGSMTSNTTGTGNETRNFNPSRFSGDLWLIGASFNNPDTRVDGFKLTNLAVIPEPTTWAMMIGGFGMVGGAMRRRARATAVTA